MKRAIKNHRKDFIAILGLFVASIIVSVYIVTKERLKLPFLSKPQYTLNAEFTTAKSVTPGQGQTVNISGVQVGEITGVSVKDGDAVVTMSIDSKYQNLIHRDATALLRPRTGLEDMMIELDPAQGANDPTPIAQTGYTIPLSNTMPTIESDEVLSSLNTDTRDYLDLLVNGVGTGLQNNGGSRLAKVLERFEPTHRDLARLQQALATRGRNLQDLIDALRQLNAALAQKKTQIVSLIKASAQVFHAFAVEGGNISRAVADLPGTLSQTRTTLLEVQRLANALGPAAQNLLPAAREIPNVNQHLIQLDGPNGSSCGTKSTCLIVKNQVRPFTRAAQPVVRSLVPVAQNLAAATPKLASSFVVLNHLFNMLGYYPSGGQHGYLWWMAWLDHNARTLFSQQDANGVFRPLFLQFSCQQLGMITTTATGPLSALGALGLPPSAKNPGGLNLLSAEAACKAAGMGSSGPGGLGGLPPLPLPNNPTTLLSAARAGSAGAAASGAKTSGKGG